MNEVFDSNLSVILTSIYFIRQQDKQLRFGLAINLRERVKISQSYESCLLKLVLELNVTSFNGVADMSSTHSVLVR